MRELIAIGTMLFILAASGSEGGSKTHAATCGLSNLAVLATDCQP
jgi:hypothetical protein